MPHVIVIRGPIGAGKTTTMNEAAKSLPDFSAIEVDALKRMIDQSEPSEWRRHVALNSALYMGRALLARGRSIITEVHSRWEEQSYEFLKLADSFQDTHLHRILVTAPYEVCLERARQRTVPDIRYAVDDRMVTDYYVNLQPTFGETVIDTSAVGPVEAARIVVDSLANNLVRS